MDLFPMSDLKTLVKRRIHDKILEITASAMICKNAVNTRRTFWQHACAMSRGGNKMKRKKILILIACVFVLVFGLSIYAFKIANSRDTEQAKYYTRKLLGWTYLAQGLTNVLIVIFVGNLVDFYSTLAPETRALAMRLSTMHASMAVFFWPVSFVLPNALRASNDVKFTMWVGIGSMIACRIFGSWVLCVQLGWGAVGVWAAMICDWLCRTSFFVPRVVRGKWKGMYKAE